MQMQHEVKQNDMTCRGGGLKQNKRSPKLTSHKFRIKGCAILHISLSKRHKEKDSKQ